MDKRAPPCRTCNTAKSTGGSLSIRQARNPNGQLSFEELAAQTGKPPHRAADRPPSSILRCGNWCEDNGYLPDVCDCGYCGSWGQCQASCPHGADSTAALAIGGRQLYRCPPAAADPINDWKLTIPRLWAASYSFESECQDQDSNCATALASVASLGIGCSTQLDQVDVDTVPLPDPLPDNPTTGQKFTEAEMRGLLAQVVPRITSRYGSGISLGKVCPVTCHTCDAYTGPILPPPQSWECTVAELTSFGGQCGLADLADFCGSICYTASIGPWVERCGNDAKTEVELDSLPATFGFMLRQMLAASLVCADGSNPAAGGNTAAESCWGGGFTRASCCAPPDGDASCWSGEYTFEGCCAGGLRSSGANNQAYTIMVNGTTIHGAPVYINVMKPRG